jgi:hypothetical protein
MTKIVTNWEVETNKIKYDEQEEKVTNLARCTKLGRPGGIVD